MGVGDQGLIYLPRLSTKDGTGDSPFVHLSSSSSFVMYELTPGVEQSGRQHFIGGQDMKAIVKNGLWVLAVAILVWMGASVRAAVISPLMTAFQATKATPQGFSINGWVEMAGTARGMSLRQWVNKLATQSHVTGTVQQTQGADYQKADIHATIAGFKTELIAERLASGATYLVIDRVGSQGFHGLSESTALVRRILAPYGAVHLSLTLQGTLPHPLTVSQEESLVNQAFRAVGASRVNGIQTPQYVSVAGYTAFIHSHDSLQGHAVNLQVATNYNTYWDEEQVDVGTPLVTVTY
ncbi:MAG: hypothetical protein C7B44_00430 [Sulfobacillus thermosulfidooxidans]|nr:MAG: hypothetical protein C7B44_00430 [Sulfobacillus thermosulfidooxidans]